MVIESQEGEECKSKVGKSFSMIKAPKERLYGIFLNLKAIKDDGDKIDLIRNHERLHVLFSFYKKNQAKVKEAWIELSRQEKDLFLKSHPAYNFKNTNILYKEFFSYKYQNNFE